MLQGRGGEWYVDKRGPDICTGMHIYIGTWISTWKTVGKGQRPLLAVRTFQEERWRADNINIDTPLYIGKARTRTNIQTIWEFILVLIWGIDWRGRV